MMTHSREKPHHCKHCNKSFARKDSLVSHMKVHEQSEVKSQGLYPYQFCTRPFSINITVCKVFHCKYCSKYFPSNSRLVQHMLTHRKEKSCNGQDCNQSFFKKSHPLLDNMKAHVTFCSSNCTQHGHTHIHEWVMPWSVMHLFYHLLAHAIPFLKQCGDPVAVVLW